MTVAEFLTQSINLLHKALGFECPTSKAVTADTTLTAADPRNVAADTTSAALALTLPAVPYDGMEYRIFDGAAAGSWNTNNVTLTGVSGGAGKQIAMSGAAAANTVTLSTRSGSVTVRYYATSDKWHQLL